MNASPLSPFWIERLQPSPQEATLPLSKARSKVYSPKRAEVSAPLSASTEAWARGVPAEIAPALAAATVTVLGCYSGLSRISIGCGIPGEAPGVAVLVLELTADDTFAGLRGAAATAIDEARAHGLPSLAALHEALNVAAIDTHEPLFSVAVRVPGVHQPLGDVRHDVTVELTPGERAIKVEYAARLFAADAVERFATHVVRALEAGLTSPAVRVREVDLLGEAERALLSGFAGRARAEDPRPIHELFEAQVARTPDAEALVYEGETMTFAELDARANRLAHALAKRGAKPGQCVGLAVTPAARLLVATLAIVKTGAAAVPLDPTFPAARVGVMVNEAALTLVVTESAHMRLFDPALERIALDELEPALEREPATSLGRTSSASDVLYVIFTSGSTGLPKGVALPHRALSNLLHWQRDRGEDPAGKRTLQRTSIGFDVGWQEVFSTWCFGGSLVVMPDAARADVSQLAAWIAAHHVARVFLPPVGLYQLAESFATQSHDLSKLREVIVAGEALHVSVPVIRMFRQLDATLDNQYGPTETHVVTAHRLDGPSTRWPATPPIGKPIDNVRVHILDASRRPVPIGVFGEIYVSGPALADGYWRNPGATAERFVADPSSSEPGARMYRTGDLGRYDGNGVIEFAGRRDDQVKIRGYRIELGDIEHVLAEAPGVLAAAVTVQNDDLLGAYLVAYVRMRDASLSLGAVRDFLEHRLPIHMVPALNAFVRVDALPLTATGKVDRKALLRLERRQEESIGDHTPTRTTLEDKLAHMWRKALGVDKLGVHDGFAELGGHSLVAIRLASEINDLYGISVRLTSILNGSIATTAAAIEALLAARDGARQATSAPSEAAVVAPLAELREVVLPGGLRLFAPHRSEVEYLYADVFEHKTYEQHGVRIEPGACVVDVGAHVGLFALYVQKVAPGAKVYAFEPAPPLADALIRNTSGRVDIKTFPMALSKHRGRAELVYYPSLSGMSSFYPNEAEERALLGAIVENQAASGLAGAREILGVGSDWIQDRLQSRRYTCELRTLSEIVAAQKIERIDLLKIDVQKAELDVLEGIDDATWPRIAQAVIEVHDLDGRLARIVELLGARGFRVKADQHPIHRGSVVHFAYAVRA